MRSFHPFSQWCLLWAGMLGGEALAQGDSGADLYDLSLRELVEVRVTTASLFASSALNAPANVAVVESEEWQRQGARRTDDIFSLMPSMQVLPVSFGYNVIAMRGYSGIASSRGIATTLDGVRLNNFTFGTAQTDTPNINPGILDRVEVIRGPASAIHGSDAFHGVITLQAFESEVDQAGAQAGAGENGYYQTAARYSGQLADPVRLNVALASSGQSDQQMDYTSDPVSKEHFYQSRSMSLKLVSDPDQSLSWRWGLYADDYDAEGYPSSLSLYDTGQDAANWRTRLSVVKTLSDKMSLETGGYFLDGKVERWAYPPPQTLLQEVDNWLEESAAGLAVTLRSARLPGEHTQWAMSLGHDVVRFDDARVTVDNGDIVISGEPGGVGESRAISSAVFDADTRFAQEQWGVSYGLRFDRYSDFGNEVSPRAGLRYLPTPDSAIKLLYGHAFRAPTAAELYFVPLSEAGYTGNPDLKPETMDSLELVFMQQGRDWQGELVLFGNRWDDAILLDFDSPASGDYVNTGENKSHGVETRWLWETAVWQVNFNTSWTRSHNVTRDEDYRLFPRLMSNLVVGREVASLSTRFTLAARYATETDDVPDFGYNAPHELEDFLRLDLNATRSFGKALDGYVQFVNLLDRDNHVPSVLGVAGGIPDQRRGMNVGVRYGW